MTHLSRLWRRTMPKLGIERPGDASTSRGWPTGLGVDVTKRSKVQAARAFGPAMYAFLFPEGYIKIGWSSDLPQRRTNLGASWDNLLALKRGTIDDERRLHRRIDDRHRHHGIEYYYPTPEIIAMLNEWRRDLGLEPIKTK